MIHVALAVHRGNTGQAMSDPEASDTSLGRGDMRGGFALVQRVSEASDTSNMGHVGCAKA